MATAEQREFLSDLRSAIPKGLRTEHWRQRRHLVAAACGRAGWAVWCEKPGYWRITASGHGVLEEFEGSTACQTKVATTAKVVMRPGGRPTAVPQRRG